MVALGRFLIFHNRALRAIHRVTHWKPAMSCVVCAAVWAYLETVPSFSEAIEQGEADIAAGRGVRWEDIR